MTQGIKDAILTIYDEGISKNKAVQSICKMYAMERHEVIEILKEGGRKTPYEKRQEPDMTKEAAELKATVKEAQEAAVDRGLPVANYIYEVLAD